MDFSYKGVNNSLNTFKIIYSNVFILFIINLAKNMEELTPKAYKNLMK